MKLLGLISLLLLFSVSANAETLRVVTTEHPPYEFVENGEIKGINTDIVKYAFRKANQPITIEIFPWKRALNLMKTGQADVLYNALYTDERNKYLDYSQVSLITEHVVILTLRNSSLNYEGDISHLAGLTIGARLGFSYGPRIDNAMEMGVINRVEVDTDKQLINMLLYDRLDAVVADRLKALDQLKETGKLDLVKVHEPSVQMTPTYIVFAKSKGHLKLRDKIDIILNEMAKDGTTRSIISAYTQ